MAIRRSKIPNVFGPHPRANSAELEVTVNGELGPLLRSALPRRLAARTQRCTVVRLVAPPSMDLPALVETLDSMGLNVASVRRVER